VQLRKAEGCKTVEMEAAAFFAIAQFRKVAFGQLL
jgi:purine-nucleoside phosphorylase